MSAEAQINIDVNTQGAQNSLDKFQGAIDTLGGSVEVVFGSLALFGVENEWISNLEQGAVGAIALADGAKRMTEGIIKFTGATTLAEAAQAAFNVVANANPYVLLGTAIVAAAGALFLFKQRAKQAAAEAKLLREEVAKQNFDTIKSIQLTRTQLKNEKNLRDYQARVSTKTVKELNTEIGVGNTRIAEQTAVVDQQVTALENLDKQFQRQAAALQANFDARKITTEQYEEQSTALKESVDAQKEDIEFSIERARIAIEQNEAYIDIANAELEKRGEQAQARREARQDANDEATEAARLAREAAQAKIDAENEYLDTVAALEEELYYASLSLRDKERKDLENQYYERLNVLDLNRLALLESKKAEGKQLTQAETDELAELNRLKLAIENQYLLDKQALEKQFADEDNAAQAEKDAKRLEQNQKAQEDLLAQNKAYAERELQFKTDLAKAEEELEAAKRGALLTTFEFANVLAGENEKAQKALFLVSKGVEAAQVAVDTIRSVSSIKANTKATVTDLNLELFAAVAAAAGGDLKAAGQIPIISGLIASATALGAKQVAATTINGAASIAKILATTIGGAGGAAGGGGGDTGATSPGFILGSSIPNQNQQGANAPNVQAGGPVQAYVLAGDVSNGLEAEQKINSRRKL